MNPPQHRFGLRAFAARTGTRLVPTVLLIGLSLAGGGARAFLTSGPSTLYVDPASVGGICSDARTAAQVSQATPWCSLQRAIASAPDGRTVEVRRSTIPYTSDHWPLGYSHMQNRLAQVTFEPYLYGTASAETVTIDGLDLVGIDHETWRGFHFVGNDTTAFTRAFNAAGCNNHLSLINNDITVEGIAIDGRCPFTAQTALSHNNYTPTDGDDLIMGNNLHNIVFNAQACLTAQNDLDGMGIEFHGTDNIQVLNNNVDTQNDAINFGWMSNAVVRGNTVQTIYQSQVPSACTYHIDLIQTENHKLGPVTIDSNYFRHGGQFIIRNQAGLTIENNLITNVYGFMQVVSSPAAKIVNNTFWPSKSGSGDLIVRSCNPLIQNCSTIYGNGYYTSVAGTIVENNIFDTWGVDTRATSGGCCVTSTQFTEDHNLIYGPKQNSAARNPGTHDVYGVPVFGSANPVSPPQFVLANGSLGYGGGTATLSNGTAAPATDLVGTVRPSNTYDIGALQHGTSTASPLPPATPTATPATVLLNNTACVVTIGGAQTSGTCSGTFRP